MRWTQNALTTLLDVLKILNKTDLTIKPMINNPRKIPLELKERLRGELRDRKNEIIKKVYELPLSEKNLADD